MEFKIKIVLFLYKIGRPFKKLFIGVKRIIELMHSVCLIVGDALKLVFKRMCGGIAHFISFFVSVFYFFLNQNKCDIDERKYIRAMKKVKYPLKRLEIRFKTKNIFSLFKMVFSALYAGARMLVLSVGERITLLFRRDNLRITELKNHVEQKKSDIEEEASAEAENTVAQKLGFFKTPRGKTMLKRSLFITGIVLCVFATTQITQYTSTYAYESSAVKNNLIEAYSVDINGITCAIITDTQKAESLIAELKQEYDNEHKVDAVVGTDVKFKKVYTTKVSLTADSDLRSLFMGALNFKISAVQMFIDNVSLGYFESIEEAQKILKSSVDEYCIRYIGEETEVLDAYMVEAPVFSDININYADLADEHSVIEKLLSDARIIKNFSPKNEKELIDIIRSHRKYIIEIEGLDSETLSIYYEMADTLDKQEKEADAVLLAVDGDDTDGISLPSEEVKLENVFVRVETRLTTSATTA